MSLNLSYKSIWQVKVLFKRITVLFLIVCLIFSTASVAKAQGAVSTGAVAYVLMDGLTGDILASQNSDKKLSMASTTKIMTALLLMEAGDPSASISVTSQMVNVEGSNMGLRAGYTVKRSDLYYGLMLPSGNDAANVTAYHMAGSIEGFSVMMNDKAKTIGMKNTNFVTPSGLDAKDHYTTAYDMALLTRYALKNDTFKKVCSTYSIKLYYADGYHTLVNHNKMLKSYKGCIGVKTGYTSKSGRCLVTAAERDGRQLICVTLNDYSDWDDHKRLLDYGFSLSVEKQLSFDIPQTAEVVGGCANDVRLRADPCTLYLFEGQQDSISYKVNIDPIIYSPVDIGQKVGYIDIYIKEELYSSRSIIALTGSDYAVAYRKKKSIFECLKEIFSY